MANINLLKKIKDIFINKDNLDDLSESELAKKKVIAEIKNLNKSVWKQPSFWTLLIAIIATIYSWQSGLFETKSKILELKNMELDLRRDTLNKQIDDLLIQKNVLLDKLDSITVVIEKISSENEKIKKNLSTWKKEKQSKSSLKNEVLQFIEKLKFLVNADKLRDQEASKNYERNKDWDEYLRYTSQNTIIKQYNDQYKTQAIIYREKLSYFLPNINLEHNDLLSYQHPTNRIGLEFIIENLEYMALKLTP